MEREKGRGTEPVRERIDPSKEPLRFIRQEASRWWDDMRRQGDETGDITLPDVVDALVPQTPSDWALMLLGAPARAAKILGAGLGASLYTEDAEASSALKNSAKLVKKIAAKVSALRKDPKSLEAAIRERQKEWARDYPKPGQPIQMVDPKTGKEYLTQAPTEDSEILRLARKLAKEDIEKGRYDPVFAVEERYYANPKLVEPPKGSTIELAVPKTKEKLEELTSLYSDPNLRSRMLKAHDEAIRDPSKTHWYAMGQLQDRFIEQFGPVEGPKQFKRYFSDAMASTTANATPDQNLLMAHYGNFVTKKTGKPAPTSALEIPYPIGSPYTGPSMDRYNRVVHLGGGLDPVAQPKGHNFSWNLSGDLDRGTIDRQMLKEYFPGLLKTEAPRPGHYGPIEGAVARAAALRKQPLAEFQGLLWQAPREKGKPMIETVNEAIARTSAVTGLSPEQVVTEGLVKRLIPLY